MLILYHGSSSTLSIHNIGTYTMHRTSKGLVVVRIAIPAEAWDEINNVARDEGITYNAKIKKLLTGWAVKRIAKRIQGEQLDAQMGWMRGDSDSQNE